MGKSSHTSKQKQLKNAALWHIITQVLCFNPHCTNFAFFSQCEIERAATSLKEVLQNEFLSRIEREDNEVVLNGTTKVFPLEKT